MQVSPQLSVDTFASQKLGDLARFTVSEDLVVFMQIGRCYLSGNQWKETRRDVAGTMFQFLEEMVILSRIC